MPPQLLTVDQLPDDNVKAAAVFYGEHLAKIETLLSADSVTLTVSLPSAPKSHDAWRRAAARDLARKFAPNRLNIIGGNEGVEFKAILTYLENAPGITGQYLAAHE